MTVSAVPTGVAGVVQVAVALVPALSATPVQRVVSPTLKVTVPVGVPLAPVTVAV